MTISALPAAPSAGDTPSQFESKALAFVAALATFISEANADIAQANADALSAGSDATDASVSATTATAAANYKGDWSSLSGALNIPASARHGNTYWMLNTNLADVTASEPGVTSDWDVLPADWTVVGTAISRTANNFEMVDVTAAGTTQTLPASPPTGATVAIHVGAFSNTTVGRNSLKIMGLSEDMTLDVPNKTTTLVYSGATTGWIIV